MPGVPGEDEYSIIEFHIQRAKASRCAKADFGKLRTQVWVGLDVVDGDKPWKLEVKTIGPLGRQTWSRRYETRADAYNCFEWYLDRHEELEEEEGVSDDLEA